MTRPLILTASIGLGVLLAHANEPRMARIRLIPSATYMWGEGAVVWRERDGRRWFRSHFGTNWDAVFMAKNRHTNREENK